MDDARLRQLAQHLLAEGYADDEAHALNLAERIRAYSDEHPPEHEDDPEDEDDPEEEDDREEEDDPEDEDDPDDAA